MTTPMSQDGGAGEHASVLISQAVRDLIQSHNYDAWSPEFGETNASNDVATVFILKVDGVDFDLTLTRAGQ